MEINKMKIWHNQKSGFNYRLWRNEIISTTAVKYNKQGKKQGGKLYDTFQLGVSMAKIPFNITLRPSARHAARLVNPYSASNHSNFLREGLITALFDLVIFAPGATHFMARQAKSTYFANPLAKGMQGLASSHLSAGIAISMWAANLLRGDDLDEEGDEYHPFEKLLRAFPLGVGGMAAISGGMYVWNKLFDKDEAERKNKDIWDDYHKRTFGAYTPLGSTGYEAAKATKKAIKTMIDRRYIK